MKKEIKKVILSMKDKQLNGFIVIKEDSIEKYGYGKNSHDELLNKYSSIVKELKEQYKDEIKDLNKQEAVDKLYKLGKIEYNNNKIITKITNCFDSDEKIEKFIVTYTDFEEEINVKDCYDEDDFFDKLKEKLVDMCNTYDIKLERKDDLTEELIKKLNSMGLLEDKQDGKILDDESLVINNKNDSEITNDTKIKNFKINRKFIAGLVAAGVIGLVLITHGCHKKSTSQIDTNDLNNNDFGEDFIDFMNEESLTDTEQLESFKEIEFNQEQENFPNYIETSDNTLIAKEYNGRSYNVFNSYYNDKNNLIEVRNFNMSNVANYIQSNIKIKDQGIYIYHENLFNNNLKDKAFVKYFSMFGNQIIKNAYQNKDFSLVVNNAIKSDEELIRLINNNEPLEVYIYGEKQYIYFNELSHDAKEMVLNIAWTNNLPLNKEIVLSGYNQDDISNIILEQSENLGFNK